MPFFQPTWGTLQLMDGAMSLNLNTNYAWVGISYLVSLDISLSIWVFFLLGRFQDAVFARPPQSPEDEDDGIAAIHQGVDDGVGQGLPAALAVAVGLALADREHRVEQQYTLARPAGELAVVGDGEAKVRVSFLEDVPEARGKAIPSSDGEGETVRLPRSVVGVLPQDDHAY